MVQAATNKVLPIGAGIYLALNPQDARASTLTEWEFFPGQTRIPEAMAPKFTSGFSTLATIDVTVGEATSGVLYCVGGIAGGFTAYLDDGFLKAEYNTLGLYRYKATSQQAIQPGDHQLQVEVRFDAMERESPATITLRVDGAEVGSGRVERSVPIVFTASETFDVGVDLGSPVALDYHDRVPFEFDGGLHRLHITYV
jgi:arylsulfatase